MSADTTKTTEERRAEVDLSAVFDPVLLNELDELTTSWIAEFCESDIRVDSILSVTFYVKNGDCYVDIYMYYTYLFKEMVGYVIMNDFLVTFYSQNHSCFEGLVRIDKLLKDKPDERFYEDPDVSLRYDACVGKRFRIDPGTRSLTLVYEGFL